MSIEIKRWLHEQKGALEKREGVPEGSMTWREISLRARIPENSLLRWKEGVSLPNFEHAIALARVFNNDEIFTVADYPRPFPQHINPALKWLFDHRNDPEVAKVIEEAQQAAENNRRTGKEAPATVQA